MIGKNSICVFVVAIWIVASVDSVIAGDPAATAAETITAEDLRSTVYFLAADEMAGREVNSLGNDISALYLAHRFELMGLRPAGDEGSYYQYFSLVQSQLSAPNQLEFKHPDSPLATTAVLKEDFYPSTLTANGRVSADVVFAGYGITAPEHGYDDYRDIEARKKIVLAMHGEPGSSDPESPFEGLVQSDYALEINKIRNAQAHDAAAIIFISDGRPERNNFARRAGSTWPEDTSRGRYQLKHWSDETRIPALHISPKTARSVLVGAPADLEEIRQEIDRQYQPHSFSVPGLSATLQTAVTQNIISSRNVLAYLPGSDQRLSEEFVIVGAHFDHVGSREGRVRKGADDDGSGTAGLLEVAEAFAHHSQKPKRSILFAAWNAEERGLLGSYFYADRPVFPLESTTAVLNMDMIGRNEEVPSSEDRRFRGLEVQSAEQNSNAVNVLGYSRSPDLKRKVIWANNSVGLELRFRYDNHVLNLLRRSDQWPFLVRGIPALFFHTGLHPDYHTAEDTPDKINYQKMEKIVRLVFLTSWQAANAEGPAP